MFSGTVTSPVAHLRGVEDRKKSEKWAQGLIEEAYQHPVAGKESLALYTFATATDLEGNFTPIESRSCRSVKYHPPYGCFNRLDRFDGTCPF